MDEDKTLLSIGAVAAASGLRTSALRYYEDEGLIRPSARIGGRRHYRSSVLPRLAIIALLQEVGFSVADLRDLFVRQDGAQQRWRETAEEKLIAIDAHMEKVEATRRLLEEALACGCGDLASCEMVNAAIERRLASGEN